MKIKYQLDTGAFAPVRAHEADAGFDIRMPKGPAVAIAGGCSATIDTGVHVLIPEGYVGFLKSKSGLNVFSHISGEGVIDAGYTGSIKVKLYNHGAPGSCNTTFFEGDKLIQLVILPIPEVELEEVDAMPFTDRGDNGFGSTGR